MRRNSDMLTVPEAALVAGVSVHDANRVIDERILPDSFYRSKTIREFHSRACILIAFFFHTADHLTLKERQRTIEMLSRQVSQWNIHRPWEVEKNLRISYGCVTIDLEPFCKSTQERLQRLKAANAIVVMDPDILSGAPVLKGTRIPVHDVAASVTIGTPMKSILAAYPGLDEETVYLAAFYAEANPQRNYPTNEAG